MAKNAWYPMDTFVFLAIFLLIWSFLENSIKLCEKHRGKITDDKLRSING